MNHNPIQRVVVKVGTSTLTHANGTLNIRGIDRICRVLSDCQNRDFEMVLVTSGAIGCGANKLGMKERPAELRFKQAAAAVGQCELLHVYNRMFVEYGQNIAQILLTHEDFLHVDRRRNLTNTFDALFSSHVIPVINENDTVAVEEIIFGDNDTLSATVAKLCMADLLIILTDIPGLFDSDPRKNRNAKLIPLVREITDDILDIAGGAGSAGGTGGMVTKLKAAEICLADNIPMYIIGGDEPEAIYDILSGTPRGTLFLPKHHRAFESMNWNP